MTDAALAADLAAEAGELLLKVRDEVGFGYPWALGDAGDSLANDLILRRLRVERPGDAVLSEEAYDDLSRLQHDRVWIIDPLDGTREFSTPGRDDWAVHIALWQRPSDGQREITDAAVSLPARGNIVYRSDTVTAGAARAGVTDTIRIAVSATRPRRSCTGCGRRCPFSRSRSARRAPRRWPSSTATSTPTCTPAASGSGTRPPRPGW
ncbi:3'-phosphoadenosine 5'-phosphate phosphatase [Mycobacterium intracellulare 1956]|uniref:3'-phosphoadenosine 5'-phosphate phosphatase n=1 Tax=Mycobacterium intracellulare 1956 TaxID=1299331 RepID=X8CRZ2_MYCIT|nr:3'-phosphoadenosine 5'-phosphate phosphatase [Mycobacterium intracellulare 1956]